MVRRLAIATAALAQTLIERTRGDGVLNTAYIERLNATFRACLAVLVRRTRGVARRELRLHAGMYLTGTIYNFCTLCKRRPPIRATTKVPIMTA